MGQHLILEVHIYELRELEAQPHHQGVREVGHRPGVCTHLEAR